MESKDELKEIDSCFYFDDIISVWNTNIYSINILLD